ncbi:MAG TPA: glycosyltransferase [Gammaproteobacteria bacterium]|nr:glycosyltransferase [Gammaproteobacteria bacterium]
MPELMHLVSMQRPAGVEWHFAELAARAAARHPDWTQSWLDPGRFLHPFFREPLQRSLARTVHLKYGAGVKLPAKPVFIRRWHCRRALRDPRPAVLAIWNRSTKVAVAIDAVGEERCIHWEHGHAWHAGRERERRRYFARVPHAIANSKASARVLELRWDYAGTVSVCRNAVRPSLVPKEPRRREYPRDSAIRLGVAARLFPVKGVALALHALRSLRAESVDAELHVAGGGPDLEPLRTLASKLGVGAHVHFRGDVRDMRSFYADIHCLVHPPLTEAFGLVAIEAAAQGVPVVATAVDGLPEAVAEGVTGYCVRPELSLASYVELGARLEHVPEQVYDPVADALCETKAVDPGALATAVMKILSSAEAYESLSRSASEHVLREYRFDAHVDEVMSVVRAFHARQ